MSAIASAPPIAPSAGGKPAREGMSKARKIGYSVLAAWLGGVVFFILVFGFKPHKAASVASGGVQDVAAGGTETCAFLPDRAVLQQHGLDPAILLPYRVAEISGVANRTDAQKAMVNNITVHAEE